MGNAITGAARRAPRWLIAGLFLSVFIGSTGCGGCGSKQPTAEEIALQDELINTITVVQPSNEPDTTPANSVENNHGEEFVAHYIKVGGIFRETSIRFVLTDSTFVSSSAGSEVRYKVSSIKGDKVKAYRTIDQWRNYGQVDLIDILWGDKVVRINNTIFTKQPY